MSAEPSGILVHETEAVIYELRAYGDLLAWFERGGDTSDDSLMMVRVRTIGSATRLVDLRRIASADKISSLHIGAAGLDWIENGRRMMSLPVGCPQPLALLEGDWGYCSIAHADARAILLSQGWKRAS